MKLFLLLLALTIPFPAMADMEDGRYLSCEDSVWILEGVDGTDMDESVKAEVRLEVKLATDPKCFDS